MFIQRKSQRLTTKQLPKLPDASPKQMDVQITIFPVFRTIVGLALIGFTIYLIYSAAGGENAIPGFNNQSWWQFLVALIPGAFGIVMVIIGQSQTLIISRRLNQIIIRKSHFFGIISTQTNKQFNDLTGLSVIKKGQQRVNFTNSLYYIVLSFNTCQSIEVLGSVSQYWILTYFQQLRNVFSQMQISQEKVIIKNYINQ